jgi:hypothetical protein
MRHARRRLVLAAVVLTATGLASTTGCTGDDAQEAAGAAPAQTAAAEAPAAAPTPGAAADVPAPGGPAPGKYGCTASRYSSASGMIEYELKGSLVLAADGTYQYLGFETPSTGRYRTEGSGTVRFEGGHLDGGEATPVEDRPGKYFLVAPGIAENRWTCGMGDGE